MHTKSLKSHLRLHNVASSHPINSNKSYLNPIRSFSTLNSCLLDSGSYNTRTFRKKHLERSENRGSVNKYYARKLHFKEKNLERKKKMKQRMRRDLDQEAGSLVSRNTRPIRRHREESFQRSAPYADQDAPAKEPEEIKLSPSQIAERKKKLHRYKASMNRKNQQKFSIRHPDAAPDSEIPMPPAMHAKFLKEYYKDSVQIKQWISPSDRSAKFAETMQLLQSKSLNPHRAIRLFDKKIKKYSLHLALQDYMLLLIPLVRNGYVEKVFEIYSRMKHFDNIQVTPKLISTVMRSLSEVKPENERVLSITDDNLLVLKARSVQKTDSEPTTETEKQTTSENDSEPAAEDTDAPEDESTPSQQVNDSSPAQEADPFESDPDLNPQLKPTPSSRTYEVDHVACVARAHELLNKDCLQYNIPLHTSILTEFIRVLGMHGHPKKAFTIFRKMLENSHLHNISQQAHLHDTTMTLNAENTEMLSTLKNELGEETDQEIIDALSKAKSTNKGDAQKKKLAPIEGQMNLVPDKYTYSVIIEALGHNGEIGKALNIFREIPRIYKRIPAYNALFASLSKCKDIFESKLLQEAGEVPDFSRVVLQHYQQLLKLRLNPTKHTFSLILQCIPERCYDVLREMKAQNVEADDLLQGQLLNELVDHGFWREAIKDLLPDIPVGSIPKGVMYQLFQKMVVSPTLYSVDDLRPYLRFMRDSGLRDLKLDPKLKLFLTQKNKHRLLKGLERQIDILFKERYNAKKIASIHAQREAERNLDHIRKENQIDTTAEEDEDLAYAAPAVRGAGRSMDEDRSYQKQQKSYDNRSGMDTQPRKPSRTTLNLNTDAVLSSLMNEKEKKEQV